LVAASIAVYILCSLKAGSSQIAAPLLQQYGALSAVVLKGQESWRLLSYGFLHATPIALGFNMLCLLAWGSILEKHISFLQYLVVYAVALIGAGLIGVHAHSPPFLIVGAQGAVGGVFGALVSLCMLGRIPLPLTFFVVAIVLNVGFAFVFPKAGWSVPAGGFAVGLLVGGLLGNLARLTDRVLRCKFPEWVKLELLLLLAFGAYAVSVAGVVKLSLIDVRGGLLMLGGALVVIKLVDLIPNHECGRADHEPAQSDEQADDRNGDQKSDRAQSK